MNGIKNIDVLKIDTEGSELNVLNGANDILKTVKILALEILDETSKFDDKRSKIYKILKDRYGFNLISEKKMWSLGTFSKMKAVDALFEKNSYWRGGRVVGRRTLGKRVNGKPFRGFESSLRHK